MSLFSKKEKKDKSEKLDKEPAVLDTDKKSEEELKMKLPQGEDIKSFQIIIRPHLTEKASLGTALNKYFFRVSGRATKIDVKEAIEKLYKVKVEGVTVISMPSKNRRVGRYEGKTPGFKKAIVTLREGDKIELTS
jgi:large subunit ribosomal protein L23